MVTCFPPFTADIRCGVVAPASTCAKFKDRPRDRYYKKDPPFSTPWYLAYLVKRGLKGLLHQGRDIAVGFYGITAQLPTKGIQHPWHPCEYPLAFTRVSTTAEIGVISWRPVVTGLTTLKLFTHWEQQMDSKRKLKECTDCVYLHWQKGPSVPGQFSLLGYPSMRITLNGPTWGELIDLDG